MSPPVAVPDLLRYIGWLMDRDRKSTVLKSLQGKVWTAGFTEGDVVPGCVAGTHTLDCAWPCRDLFVKRAAREAGMETRLVVRDGNALMEDRCRHVAISSFETTL